MHFIAFILRFVVNILCSVVVNCSEIVNSCGVIVTRRHVEIIETMRMCLKSFTPECCSYGFWDTLAIIYYFMASKLRFGRVWLTTTEICKGLGVEDCNRVRVYLYRLKRYGILEARRLYINKTIWKLNKDALIKDHSYTLEQVMSMIFTYVATCRKYHDIKAEQSSKPSI
jgi:hypothetical protein